MNLQNMLNQFTSQGTPQQGDNSSTGSPLSAIASAIPGGLAGGAAAGGVMALLMGSKSARKMAGSAAKIGGTALLGGLAYKAFTNWQQNRPMTDTQPINESDVAIAQSAIPEPDSNQTPLHLTLIKAMISAAKADGHLDAIEQKNIFEAVDKMQLSDADKSAVFDAMSRDISVYELAKDVKADEHKAEVYLSAFLAIEVDEQRERDYLVSLATALDLPKGLPAYLEQQAVEGIQ